MHISRSALLDVATAGLVVAALATLVRDRVLPALEERARLDPGDRAGEIAWFRTIGGGDTVRIREEGGTLLLVFRSTCAVCESSAPTWAGLALAAPERVFPIGLEDDASATAWVAERLPVPGLAAAAPLDPAAFVDRLRIRAVPTTLLFEDGRLVLSRIGPLQADDKARIDRVLRGAGTDAPFRGRLSRQRRKE
ncbi:MAG: hypothetical protein R3266_01155 [Gemmatimonadota bacterium]|nr:hypothetical protein [Gemmatimonadota bacterium]